MSKLVNNYDRYKTIDALEYEKRTLLSFFLGNTNYNIIRGFVIHIKNKKVLELGCGTGKYTKLYAKNNKVACIDINPHLFSLSGVRLIKGNVIHLDSLISEKSKYEYILSFFLTEYLPKKNLLITMRHCKKHIVSDGRIVSTFISNGLWGLIYIYGAKIIKGINKYAYSILFIKKMALDLKLDIVEIKKIRRFGITFAYVVVFKKGDHDK